MTIRERFQRWLDGTYSPSSPRLLPPRHPYDPEKQNERMRAQLANQEMQAASEPPAPLVERDKPGQRDVSSIDEIMRNLREGE